MWDDIRGLFANPILIKHVRSRLRRQSVLSGLAVLVMINLCLAYAGYALDWYQRGYVAGGIVAIQIVLLGVMGSAQVNASVNGARASGILDFHRVSPLTATELTLGFFFGAPIREYALFAATIPFTIICMAFGIPTFRGFFQLGIIVLTSSWVIHAVMLLSGLISKTKNPTGGALGMIVFLLFFFAYIVIGATQSVYAVESDYRLNFFGISLPWLPVVLLYQLPILFFLLLAATRKMESQRLHPLSKPQAIVAMVTFAVLVVGGIWRQGSYEMFQLASLYLLPIPALLLTMMIVPTQAEYTKGLHRARKQGKTRLPWWDDLSVNGFALVILPAIVLLAGTIADTIAIGEPSRNFFPRWPIGSYPLALAAAVLTVAYYGLGLQYFQLRFARRGTLYFGLFLFVAWLVPILAGWIQAAASAPSGEVVAYPIFALSPVAGIGMVFTIGDRTLAYPVQAAAVTPILLFTFVYAHLLIGARRRIIRGVHAAIAEKPSAEVEPEFAEPLGRSS